MVTIVIVAPSRKEQEDFPRIDRLELEKRLKIEARSDFLAGRAAISACVKRIGHAYKGITYTPFGSPKVIDFSQYFCGISHSSGYGMAGISKKIIGVDIEVIKQRTTLFLEYLLSSEEKILIDKLDKNIIVVTFVWTVKEAVLKAIGLGLAYSCSNLVLQKLNITKNGCQTLVHDKKKNQYWIVDTIFTTQYYLSIAQQQEHYTDSYDITYQ